MWIYVGLLAMLAYVWLTYDGGTPVKTEWNVVKERLIPAGDIDKIVYISNMDQVMIYLRKDRLEQFSNEKIPSTGPHFYFIVGSNRNIETELEEAREQLDSDHRFKIEVEKQSNFFGRLLEWMLLPILLIAFWLLMFRSRNRFLFQEQQF